METYLLVDNIEEVQGFLSTLLQTKENEEILQSKGVKYITFTLQNNNKIALMDRTSCANEQQLNIITKLSSQTIKLTLQDIFDKNIDKLKNLITTNNYKIIENNDNIIIFEGIEKITFIILLTEPSTSNNNTSILDYILSYTTTASPTKRIKQKAIPKQISTMPTLEAAILTNNGNNHVIFSPNSKEPIPFETESFIGTAMLVVRTDPIDPLFRAFFEGRRLVYYSIVNMTIAVLCMHTCRHLNGTHTSTYMHLFTYVLYSMHINACI